MIRSGGHKTHTNHKKEERNNLRVGGQQQHAPKRPEGCAVRDGEGFDGIRLEDFRRASEGSASLGAASTVRGGWDLDLTHQGKLLRVLDGFDAQINVKVRPV